MTLTKLSLDDVQHSADLRAAICALLADGPQTFTPPPPPPEPKHLPLEYRHEPGHDTRDVLATTFLERVLTRTG
jgi:hypothetical protein